MLYNYTCSISCLYSHRRIFLMSKNLNWHQRIRRTNRLWWLLAVLIAGGCSSGTENDQMNGKPCSSDYQCASDEACIEGSCKSVDVGQYVLSGVVTDWSSGIPLKDVEVSISKNHSDTTDSTGHYALSQLSNRTYSVTWSKSGYHPNTKKIQMLGADKQFNVELALDTERRSLSVEFFGETSHIFDAESFSWSTTKASFYTYLYVPTLVDILMDCNYTSCVGGGQFYILMEVRGMTDVLTLGDTHHLELELACQSYDDDKHYSHEGIFKAYGSIPLDVFRMSSDGSLVRVAATHSIGAIDFDCTEFDSDIFFYYSWFTQAVEIFDQYCDVHAETCGPEGDKTCMMCDSETCSADFVLKDFDYYSFDSSLGSSY